MDDFLNKEPLPDNQIPLNSGDDATPTTEKPKFDVASAEETPSPTPGEEANAENNLKTPDIVPSAPLSEPPKKEKKKISVGKIIFITLTCIAIIVASICFGVVFSRPVSMTETATTTETVEETDQHIAINGAEITLQESPLVFEEYTGKGSMTPDQVYSAVKDVNVGILVYYNGQMIGEGSGIIVGEDDNAEYTYIITAAHVICDKGIDVQVQFSDESECDAQIIGFDSKTDIGVVRVKKTGLKAAVFGNSDSLVVGQAVYAIGNPGGTEFFGSFTSGIVSAIDRPVPTTSTSYDLPCIQHNAAINPGNSGGALVNEFGQVIGLNSSKISSTEYEGMGFSVPSNTMLEIYEQILKYGYVSGRPMLGINYVAVSNDQTYGAIAWQNDLPYGSIVIATISPSSDLNNTEAEVGDLIIAVNGKDLDNTDVLLEVIENADVGTEIELTICRLSAKGTVEETFDITVTLVEDIGDNTGIEPEEQSHSVEEYLYGE